MTYDSNPVQTEDVSQDVSDVEIEQLLGDAYDAPAIPRTLLKRLDREVERQWGTSPRLSRKEPGWLGRFGRSMKSWPAAACLIVAVVLSVVFYGDARAYGWAAMIEALSKQPVVQIGDENDEAGVRWVSVSEGIVGQRSSGRAWLFDFRRGTALTRVSSESRVNRVPLKEVSAAGHDRIVIAFLLGNLSIDGNVAEFPDLQVVNESWSQTGEFVDLQVTLGGNDRTDLTLNLNITIDPDTHLPRAVRVMDRKGVVRNLAISYPESDAATLSAQDFPANLPVADVGNAFATTNAIAPKTQNGATNRDGPPGKVAPEGNGAVATNVPAKTALFGAASLGWDPVAPIDFSRDEVLNRLNSTLERLWKENSVVPAAPASDEELLRRVYLDLAGRIPTVHEVRNYLQDTSPDRYTELVDRLLESRDHSTHLATVWRTFLLPEGIDLTRFGGTPAFDDWLSGQFTDNVAYDKLVRRLMLAEGRLTKSGPLLFYTSMKLDADQLAARTSRVFLGMRLECAQCHDDPFEPWTQEDFWSFAAFFARISRPQVALENVSTVMRVRDVNRGEVKLPDTDTVVGPKFLDGTNIDESPKAAARRHQLALWLSSPNNPFFARAAVNRVWAHLFGHGIVDPVDGFGERHPPRSPELMDLLAGHFIATDFNLREIFRTIALSDAYQLSSGSDTPDQKRHDWFAQMNVKTLTAEQVYDCITVATMLVSTDSDGANGFNLERVGNSSREAFLAQFRTPAGKTTEYHGGIPQALTLMNGTLINSATGLADSGLLKSLEAPFFTDDQRIEVLYLATMSRKPSPSEWVLLRNYIKDRAADVSVQEPLADVLWALLNGAEFTMNH